MTLRVLLVDDDPSIIDMITTVITGAMEVDIVVCNEGASGHAKAQSEKFDLICTDYHMPGMLGTEVIKSLRVPGSTNAQTPILFVTGHHPGLIPDAQVWEGVFFIAKPFREQELLFFVRSALKQVQAS